MTTPRQNSVRSARLPCGTQTISGRWPISNDASAGSAAITAVTITTAPDADFRLGLLAYVEIEIDGIVLVDGLALRRTARGRLSLSFPSRTSRSGMQHQLVRPRDAVVRRRIEDAVIDAIGIREAKSTNSLRRPSQHLTDVRRRST